MAELPAWLGLRSILLAQTPRESFRAGATARTIDRKKERQLLLVALIQGTVGTMFNRIWRVAHPLLTLAAVGCCVYLLLRPTAPVLSGRASDEADHALRRFLNVQWIGGDAELPPDVHHCAVVLFVYKDGQFDHRKTAAPFSPNGGSRVIPMGAMWAPTSNGVRGAAGGYWNDSDPVWEKLDGGVKRCFGTTTDGEVHGFRIIGFATSRECQPGSERFENIMGGFAADAIKVRRYVLLLGYKPLASQQAAEDYVMGKQILRDFPE
jgi:hypothetical protein